MKSLTDPRIFAHIELESPNCAEHLGKLYFFCTTEERQKFEAIQRRSGGNAAVARVGGAQERRFKPAVKVAGHPGPSPASLSSPSASFLG